MRDGGVTAMEVDFQHRDSTGSWVPGGGEQTSLALKFPPGEQYESGLILNNLHQK